MKVLTGTGLELFWAILADGKRVNKSFNDRKDLFRAADNHPTKL
jgi:hypothetical protein